MAKPPALAALVAPDLDEQPENEAMEQGPPPPQMPPVAVFPHEESHPVPAFYAADTAFDCEDGEGAASWCSCSG